MQIKYLECQKKIRDDHNNSDVIFVDPSFTNGGKHSDLQNKQHF